MKVFKSPRNDHISTYELIWHAFVIVLESFKLVYLNRFYVASKSSLIPRFKQPDSDPLKICRLQYLARKSLLSLGQILATYKCTFSEGKESSRSIVHVHNAAK